MGEDIARIMTLSQKKGIDLYPRSHYRLPSKALDETNHQIQVTDTRIKGGYNIHVVVSAQSTATKVSLQETRIISFLVVG
jgi:hypothetical protein